MGQLVPLEVPSSKAAAGMREPEHDHVVAEGLAQITPLGLRLGRDVVVVRPQDHPSFRSDPFGDPFRVLGHGHVAILFTGAEEVELDGDPQALKGHLEAVFASHSLVPLPVRQQQFARCFEGCAALGPIRVRLVPVTFFRPSREGIDAVGIPVETLHQRLDFRGVHGIHLPQVFQDIVKRQSRKLHVEPMEGEIAAALVVFPHPLEHREHRFRAPDQKDERRQGLRRVPFTRADIAIRETGFGPARFHGEGVETHLFDEKAEDPELHLEEIAGAVRVFAQGDDAGVAHHFPQELDIAMGQRRVRPDERVRVGVDPRRDFGGYRTGTGVGRRSGVRLRHRPRARGRGRIVAAGRQEQDSQDHERSDHRLHPLARGDGVPAARFS